MRRLTHTDIVAAARLIYPLPPRQANIALGDLLKRTRSADIYRRRMACVHPQWGDGTLAGAARQFDLLPEPPLSDAHYRACIVAVLQALDRERG